jgi:tetratricopeptide (TPR) repeat protein
VSDPNPSRPADEAGANSSEPTSEEAKAADASTPVTEAETKATIATGEDAEPGEPEQSDAADGNVAESDNPDVGSAGKTDEKSGDGATDSGEPESEGDLPEWEPLTPEDIEDEAIRGDFMLRWAVVLLAFLLGCREIGDTLTLVRVKTGEAIAANGFWPPATDIFSYTAGDLAWINPAWLFDLILAGVFGIAGDIGLSVLTAILAGATAYIVVHISRPDLPTWWTAVCVTIALLMAQSQFSALPELITLLGTAWMLRGLVKWSQSRDSRILWCLAGSLAVWSNLDPRAFIGWLILAAFAAGSCITMRRRGDSEPGAMKDLGKAVGIGLVALMINPAGWHTILAPVQIYGAENAALLSYAGRIDTPTEAQLLSMFDARFPETLNLASIAALVLAAIAVLSCIANVKRLDMGLAAAFAVTVVLAVVCTHELGALCLVAGVLAALNGQDWYRNRCRQEYSTDTWEVLWSRSGRALTVLSLAMVAWLAISGRMMGPSGKRIGVGFASWLQSTIDGTAQDLAEIPDARLFTMRLEHGDLLIWHGRPTFIDSRVGLYRDEILKLHDQARFAMRSRRDQSLVPDSTASETPQAKERRSWRETPELWQEIFDRFDVGLATPRLWGANPDYDSLFDLLRSDNWHLVSIGSTLAALAPRTSASGSEAKPIDLIEVAFRDCRNIESENQRIEFPRARTGYQQFLSLPSRSWSPSEARARHQQAIAVAGFSGEAPLTRGQVMALATMALRDSTAGAVETPNNDVVYRTRADAYTALRQVEIQAAGPDVPVIAKQRYFQRIHFLRQALTLAPNDPGLLSAVAQEYYDAERWDLALQMIDRCLNAIQESDDFSFSVLARQLQSIQSELQNNERNITSRLDVLLKDESVDVVQIAKTLRDQGYPLHGARLLDENKLDLSGNISGQLEYGLLLIECGRLEEAQGVVSTFDSFGENPAIGFIWTLHAAWLDQARGDAASAIVRCERKLREIELNSVQALLAVAPFVQPIPQLAARGNLWPVSQTVVTGRTFGARDESAILRWVIASVYVESGQCEKATEVFHMLLETDPESPLRPLAAMYLGLLTGESIPVESPTEQIPILFVGGPEDPEPPTPVADEADAGDSDADNPDAVRK